MQEVIAQTALTLGDVLDQRDFVRLKHGPNTRLDIALTGEARARLDQMTTQARHDLVFSAAKEAGLTGMTPGAILAALLEWMIGNGSLVGARKEYGVAPGVARPAPAE